MSLNKQFTPLAYSKKTVRLLKCRAVFNLNAGPFLKGLALALYIIILPIKGAVNRDKLVLNVGLWKLRKSNFMVYPGFVSERKQSRCRKKLME